MYSYVLWQMMKNEDTHFNYFIFFFDSQMSFFDDLGFRRKIFSNDVKEIFNKDTWKQMFKWSKNVKNVISSMISIYLIFFSSNLFLKSKLHILLANIWLSKGYIYIAYYERLQIFLFDALLTKILNLLIQNTISKTISIDK